MFSANFLDRSFFVVFILPPHEKLAELTQRKNQGRTIRYPAVPSQISACGTAAPGGSSNLLTYALTIVIQKASAVYWGTFSNLRSGYQKLVQQVFKSGPVVTQPLAKSVEPFEQDVSCPKIECLQTAVITDNTIIVPVTAVLGPQGCH